MNYGIEKKINVKINCDMQICANLICWSNSTESKKMKSKNMFVTYNFFHVCVFEYDFGVTFKLSLMWSLASAHAPTMDSCTRISLIDSPLTLFWDFPFFASSKHISSVFLSSSFSLFLLLFWWFFLILLSHLVSQHRCCNQRINWN